MLAARWWSGVDNNNNNNGSLLICRLKAIANELGQSEALVGGTSVLAEPGLPRAEERHRLQPPGMAIDNESLKQFLDGGRKSNRAIAAHSMCVFLFLLKRDNRRCSLGLWAPSRSPARVQDTHKFFLHDHGRCLSKSGATPSGPPALTFFRAAANSTGVRACSSS